MYGTSSPIFDIPEFPPLRRVKPLPKRRRTSNTSLSNFGDVPSLDNLIVPELTPDELATTFSNSMAIQSYYMPILNGMNEMFKQDHDTLNNTSMDLAAGLKIPENFPGQDDIDQGEAEYVDQLQQPGNTKKRKVPVTNSTSHLDDSQSSGSGPDEDLSDRNLLSGLRPEDIPLEPVPPVPPPGSFSPRRRRLTPATYAALQHKELLKSRKRQLGFVLGSFSQTDSFALDQALSSAYPFARARPEVDLNNVEGFPIRLSRRHNLRLNRKVRQLSIQGSQRVKFPVSEFTCSWPSVTSERLVATRDEVTVLRARFEAELTRQAAKTAEVVKQAGLAVNQSHALKRGDRTRKRAGASNVGSNNEQNPGFLDPAYLNSKGKSKKKKRSALANASNPHHLRNYVPSRLPYTVQGNTGNNLTSSQNCVSPPPLKFLSAEIPHRRKKLQQSPAISGTLLTHPEDEWICAFCEYSLFFGDELALRRSVRSRKKILSRRRRAVERAAAAANGKRPAANITSPLEKAEAIPDDVTNSFDSRSGVFPSQKVNRRGDREKDRERDVS